MKEIEIVHLTEGVKFLGEAPSTPELQAWHARLEQEKATRKAAWESKSPDEKEQLEREEIKRGLKGAALSPGHNSKHTSKRPSRNSGPNGRRTGEKGELEGPRRERLDKVIGKMNRREQIVLIKQRIGFVQK